jgi:hypothetical protein
VNPKVTIGRFAVFSFAAFAVYAAASCTPLTSMWKSTQGNRASAEKNVPQSVASERPLVSNAFAYARYVAINLSETPRREEWTESEIKSVFQKAAQQSGIPEIEALKFYSMQVPSQAEGRTNQRIGKFRQQVRACMSDSKGWSHGACCRALAGPAALIPEPSDAQTLESSGSESRFRVQGMKAWLSVCHTVISGQPATLADFRKLHDYQSVQPEDWTKKLHARSRAKRGPRRLYRSAEGDVAVAETLVPEDCSVLETEVIVRRPDGALNFWVYDARGQPVDTSHFPPAEMPAGGGPKTVEKPSPDSCMGCHYDLKTRQFNVQFPSADELKLPSTKDLPVLCRQTGESLAEDN